MRNAFNEVISADALLEQMQSDHAESQDKIFNENFTEAFQALCESKSGDDFDDDTYIDFLHFTVIEPALKQTFGKPQIFDELRAQFRELGMPVSVGGAV